MENKILEAYEDFKVNKQQLFSELDVAIAGLCYECYMRGERDYKESDTFIAMVEALELAENAVEGQAVLLAIESALRKARQ